MTVQALRQSVVDLCGDLSRRGYFAATGGNLSLRVDAERFLVTPSAVDYLAMRPEDVCLLRLRDLARLEGERTPSVETGLHARVLRARPDVVCCIHTHQPMASALALLDEAVPVDDVELVNRLGPSIPMVGYAPSGTGWLAAKLARALRPDINAYLLRNHGVVCCGAGMTEAVQAVEDLETVAKRHLHMRIADRLAKAPGLAGALQPLAKALAGNSRVNSVGAQTR
jgi:L-fuculose-phosphate aldolase